MKHSLIVTVAAAAVFACGYLIRGDELTPGWEMRALKGAALMFASVMALGLLAGWRAARAWENKLRH